MVERSLTPWTNENIPYKIYLTEDEMPRTWYNVRADMKVKPAPLRNPATGAPMSFDDLRPVFCDELIRQELDNDDREIPIPDEIRDFYKMYRPSPLVRAYCLEKLQTPAKIYYKFEGNNTSGSHKLNSAIAQAYYAKQQGLRGVTTETGAGQWGTALSMACAYLGLDCKVYMVKCSYEQKPFRREVMRTYGASVTPSPSTETEIGRRILAEHPGTTGSLGCAISEAVEVATSTPAATATCSAACSIRCCCTSRSSVWRQNSPRQIRRRAGHHHRLRRRRQQPRRPDLPVHGREAARRARLSVHRRRARLLPEPHARQVRLRFL